MTIDLFDAAVVALALAVAGFVFGYITGRQDEWRATQEAGK